MPGLAGLNQMILMIDLYHDSNQATKIKKINEKDFYSKKVEKN